MNTPKTAEQLRKIAAELGITRDRVKKEFDAQGLSGAFDPKKFDAYVAVLITASKRDKALVLLRTKMDTMKSASAFAPCPICNSPVVSAPKWDRFFRSSPRGWSCSSGGTEHFLLSCMRPAMERFADKWRFLEATYDDLVSGRITREEYERRIEQRWMNPNMQDRSTPMETTQS